MKINKYFIICGYGWSGSSAVVDLLKEYSNNYDPGVEFRLVKDPYGINDLYNACVIKGDPLNYDIAIKDFLWFSKSLYKKPSKFKDGLDYKRYFGTKYLYSVDSYINKIVSFSYNSYWWMFGIKKTHYKLIKDKIMKKLGIIKNTDKMFFVDITDKKFISITREFIDMVFENSCIGDNMNVILDQGVSTVNPCLELKFYKNSKLIIVDRDPRDIYTDLCIGGNLIGEDLKINRNPNNYVSWHKEYRKNINEIKKNKNIMFLKFEDLIYNYDEKVDEIEKFLDLDSRKHIKKYEYFDPSKSIENIGIWKNYINDYEKEVFTKYLVDYFYEK